MSNPTFPVLLQRFFTDYLGAQRNLSPHTTSGYRDTFCLLLHFLSDHYGRPVDQLDLNAITPEAVLAFLDHLERSRLNTARARNIRLAAIRTFVRFVLGQPSTLDFLGSGQRILAIPQKRAPKSLLGFMSREEIEAVFASIDQRGRSS